MQIKVENLNKSFIDGDKKIPVLSDLSFTVESGSSCAVMGKSGVGKSTLLNLLGGLEKVDSGSIVLGDFEVTASSNSSDVLARFRGSNIGYIFQFHHLFPEFNALENVCMPGLIKGNSYTSLEGRALELLEMVGMGHRTVHRPGMLSGGEQQRVSIARALMSEPELILADEPTGSLDSETGDTVAELLIKLHKELGTTLIVVSHDKGLAGKMNRVLELK